MKTPSHSVLAFWEDDWTNEKTINFNRTWFIVILHWKGASCK